EEAYAMGRTNFERFKAEGLLVADPRPCFYLYRQKMGAHEQVGFVCGASVAEYQQNRIKKHQLPRADKADDRTRHIDELSANDEPVFLTYRARPSIDAKIAALTARPPAYDFTTDDGIVHTFWVVDSDEEIAQLEREFREVPELYIADGHHRSAAA